ncbi:lipocalin family protein [Flavobacterium sp. SUN046]|uniref:lipocalin family protein n=1 Tax=Flavobacterium sp. SUN046 TaxID=3002440 RepID=UPI002DBD1945|nr:lipocalin family protein [Flavobacterium sp. SUN046]MEC4049440.1 lipocalin family protein [Flavobacterium sp. SUN046]
MKKAVSILVMFMVFTSCKQTITDKDLAKINGYWEIEKVNLADGSKKDYTVNETIDYFSVKDNKGFRQKVMPQLDGKYLTNELKEEVSISKTDGDYFVNYTTRYGKWKEEIIELRDSVLVLKNKDNIEYHYKKQIPFSVK